MIAGLPAALLGAHLLAIPVADRVPQLRVEPNCRAASVATTDIRAASSTQLSEKDATDLCVKTENEAKATLQKQWSKFNAADRTSCSNLASIGDGSTYTHLLTCLEVARDARQLPQTDGDTMTPTTGQSRSPARRSNTQ